ncbi:Uu.00g085940.m01.CDS01 [Anthostomella pinea]|uniref:Uu.00g085940.m01.CDS01 n=1 Tax=Anthostomella pinea TaxID=933095 RepID=A0AAI8VM41_9PEZI|nr:Uu.00g085940.m01.CDS01 [Anthostomella pinea]
MQFTSSFAAVVSLLAITANASPVATVDNSQLAARANSKLNQYEAVNCLNNEGKNTNTYHASPALRECKNLANDTVSFFYGLGPLTQAFAYSDSGCKGFSQHVSSSGGCLAVNTYYNDDFQVIKSFMMD